MVPQSLCFESLIFVGLLLTAGSLNIPADAVEAQEKTTDCSKEEEVNHAIVLIGLNESEQAENGYGTTPIVDEDIISLINGNSTLAHKVIGHARGFEWKSSSGAASSSDNPTSQSRLLPLITTPKKALLLFALHETLLKSHKSSIGNNCVILSKDSLMSLLQREETTTPLAEDVNQY